MRHRYSFADVPAFSVIVSIREVEKVAETGHTKHYLHVEDDNHVTGKVLVFDPDYIRFGPEMKEGKRLMLRLEPHQPPVDYYFFERLRRDDVPSKADDSRCMELPN